MGAGEGVTAGGTTGVGAGVTTGVGAGATVTAGATVGVVAAGAVSFTEVVTCCSGVWLCFESSTFVAGDVVGTALLEHPLMANNSAMNIPAIFMFHVDFKQSTPFL